MGERRREATVALMLASGLLAGCQAGTGVVPASEMSLSVLNSTTKGLVLVVNGLTVKNLQPGEQAEIDASALPALPWMAEVRLPTGRPLIALTVHAGDVVRGTASLKGDGARVDLSCGRIDLWAGPPLLGPVPGPGIPGDCDP